MSSPGPQDAAPTKIGWDAAADGAADAIIPDMAGDDGTNDAIGVSDAAITDVTDVVPDSAKPDTSPDGAPVDSGSADASEDAAQDAIGDGVLDIVLFDVEDSGSSDIEDVGADVGCEPACEEGTKGCVDQHTLWICGNAPGATCVTKIPYYCGAESTCVAGDCACEPTGDLMCWYDDQASSVYQASSCGLPVMDAGGVALLPPVVDCGGAPGCYQNQCQPGVAASEIWPLPTAADLLTVLILGPDHVVVAGANTTIYEYDHGTWTNISPMDALYTEHYVFLRGDGAVGAVTGRGYERRVGPAVWEMVHPFLADGLTPPGVKLGSYLPRAAWAFDEQNLFVATTDGGLHRAQDGAWSWVSTGYEGQEPWSDFTSVWGLTPEDVWVVGEHGRARWFDGAAAYPIPGLSVEAGGMDEDLGSVRGAPGAAVYVTRGSTVLQYQEGAFEEVYYAPETGARHRLFVASDTDIWVWGESRISHFDGVDWTVFDTGLGGTAAKLKDLSCLGPNECWAVGTEGLVLKYDGVDFSMISKGQGALPDSELVPPAVFAPTENVVFMAVDVFGVFGAPVMEGRVRRLTMMDGAVVDVRQWEVPPAAVYEIGLRGLWGSSPDSMFLSSRVPVGFDGSEWLPLDLPPDLLETHECLTLAGRGDELYVALRSKTGSSAEQILARRNAEGGPWDFLNGPPVGQIVDLWIADDGVVYAMSMPFGSVSRLDPADWWTTLLVYPLSDESIRGVRFAVSSTEELLINDGKALVYQTPAGVKYELGKFPGLLLVGGYAVPPSGPGFLIAGRTNMVELVTGDLAPGEAPTFQTYKPYAYAKNNGWSLYSAPWGRLYLGVAPDGLVTLPAPWFPKAP